MRSTVLCLFVLFSVPTISLGIDCTLRLDQPNRFDAFSGPARAIHPAPIESDGRLGGSFSPRITIPEGQESLTLQAEYCGGFDLIGDFSEEPIWEMWNPGGWAIVATPDDNDSILGNFLGAGPTNATALPDLISTSLTDLGNNRVQSTGVFDTSTLGPGEYVVGITGSYVLAEFVFGETNRVREERNWEHGFPLTVVPVPEPSGATISWLLGGTFAAVVGRRKRRFPISTSG